jgi:outer membrane murein-binding lipoprotein Lpp
VERRWQRAWPRPATAGVLALVVVGSVLLSGCASAEESGPPSARVTSWLSDSSGGTAIGTVSVDSRNVTYVLAHRNQPAAVRSACAVLTTDAQTAIGNLPTPDASLTQDLNAAYEDAAAAGTDCYNGVGKSSSLMARSARERAQLPALMATAVARIEALTGHVPSTSTTAPTDIGGDPFGGG